MMEEQEKNSAPGNGAAPESKGSKSPKARPQGDQPEVKEGNPDQQRPGYGSDAGPNTSNREEQLPSLDNGQNA